MKKPLSSRAKRGTFRSASQDRQEATMKLYMHPVSTTSRPVMQFIADNDIKCDMEVVDILKGAHYEPAYSKINPNHLIPMLEDGDFRLTESAAILRYLAEKIDSPAFPKDIKQRARVNEVMDWFNSNFYRDWGYGLDRYGPPAPSRRAPQGRRDRSVRHKPTPLNKSATIAETRPRLPDQGHE